MRKFLGGILYRLYVAILKLVLVIVPTISFMMVLIEKLTLHSLNQQGLIGFVIMLMV